MVIKTQKQYQKELKAAYDRGYAAGLDDHSTNAVEALSSLKQLAQVGTKKLMAQALPEDKPKLQEELQKTIDLVDRGYTLKEKPKDETQ